MFPIKPLVASRRPRYLKGELVRAEVRKENDIEKGMNKCGKLRCQICGFVDKGCTFQGERTYFINFPLNCDSSRVVYILSCKICQKIMIYVRSTIGFIRKRFNNRKSSATRHGKGQRSMADEQLYENDISETSEN